MSKATQTEATDFYIGTWELIPELCFYEKGNAPRSGSYTIAESNDSLMITIDWRDQSGESYHVEFAGKPDGSSQPVDSPGLTHMTLTRIDSRTLDSAAFNGDAQVMVARRVAHGDLLATMQEVSSEDGGFTIFQVYKRRTD